MVFLNCFQNSLCEARMRRSGVFSLTGLWPPFLSMFSVDLFHRFITFGFGNFSHLGYQWGVFWVSNAFLIGLFYIDVRAPYRDVVGLLVCLYTLMYLLYFDTYIIFEYYLWYIYFYPITYVLNNKRFYQIFWVVCYDPWGLCEMSPALIDGSPRMPVTVPETGLDRCTKLLARN